MHIELEQTILIVEDEALIRMHGAYILESAGFSVLEAASADEAVEVLRGHPGVHLLFSDIDMPGSMDGIELALLVRACWPEVRLVLTSGHHDLDGISLPEDGQFVSKPWSEVTLMEKIRIALAN